MDLGRLRFGDWVMGLGGFALLAVMFVDWYGVAAPEGTFFLFWSGDGELTAWEAFGFNDVILALAALMAIAAFVLTATQPTAAVPLAVASLTGLVSLLALVLVTVRMIWPPGLEGPLETARLTGAWLGLVATAVLAGGALASIRDERLPQPARQVEPRLVSL